MPDEQKLTNYAAILAALRGVRTREERTALAAAAARTLAVSLAVVLGALALESAARLDITGRTILALLTLASVLSAAGLLLGPALLRALGLRPGKTDDRVALEVGAHFPDLRDRLLNVLQLVRDSLAETRPSWSLALVDASFGDVAGTFSRVDLRPVVDTRPARRAARTAGIALLITAVAFAAFPSTLSGAAERLWNYSTDYAPPAPFSFDVRPGDREVVKGERVMLQARTSARQSQEITFHIRNEGQEEFDVVSTRRDSSGWSVHELAAIRTSITYFAEADGFRSRMYRISVVDRPFVRTLRARLTFPSHTRQQPRALDENVGDITAPTGTSVQLQLALNKEVARAELVFSDSQTVALSVAGASASGSFRVMKGRSYHVRLVDAAGIENADPITYTITPQPDLPPSIEILEPGPSTDLDETLREALLVRISDDYGFSKLVLRYRLSASKFERPQEQYSSLTIPLPVQQGQELEVPYLWNLSSLSLAPEDVVSYYVEVFDNDAVTGPKSARSPEYTLRLPSLDEVFAKADRTQEKALDDLQKTLQAAEEARKALETVQREMKQQNTDKLDWQQKKKLEDILKRHEEMQRDVKRAAQELSQLNEEMQKQNVISEETLRKYQQLQDLMKEVDSPELREAMKKMSDAMKQMTPEQMKQALENFEFNEQQFRESVERTMELLKRLQVEQKTEELTRRAEELARKQEELAQRTENADPKNREELDRLAREQRELQKEMEAMQRELKELEQKMGELPPQEMPMQEMQQAQAELNAAQMQESMSDAASMCEGGQCQSAAQKQKQASKQLKQFEQRMKQMQKKLNENQQRMVQQAFQKALDHVLELSKRQEQLRNQTTRLQPSSQQFRQLTQQQQELERQLGQTANEIMELSKKSMAVTPQMGRHLGEAMQKMNDAVRSMQNRDSRAGGEQQGGAMAQLNDAAKQLSKAMQSSKSGSSQGGGGSMMQMLRQMGQQQQNINMQTQQLGQQQGMSPQQRAQMQRLAAQQTAVQKSLEQLNEEARRSDEGRRILGDLKKIAEEMQEVVRDMQSGDVNPETIQRQERILSRLLDASRSTRERDWERKRRSQTGTDVARRSPGDLDPRLTDPQQALRSDMQKAIDEGYSRDYETLIRKYFEALERLGGDGR